MLEAHYRRFGGQRPGTIPTLPKAPGDYRELLRTLRRELRLSQSDLAELVGAANKAVVYQWESGKRVPSPVFWASILALRSRLPAETATAQSVKMESTRP